MSTLRNRVQLIGHLGKDPEVTTFEGGNKVANFTIATNESYKNKTGEKVENTQWHNIVAWGPTASIVEKYLKKGNEVALEGKLQNRTYDAKDGSKRYIVEIVADQVKLFTKSQATETSPV